MVFQSTLRISARARTETIEKNAKRKGVQRLAGHQGRLEVHSTHGDVEALEWPDGSRAPGENPGIGGKGQGIITVSTGRVFCAWPSLVRGVELERWLGISAWKAELLQRSGESAKTQRRIQAGN